MNNNSNSNNIAMMVLILPQWNVRNTQERQPEYRTTRGRWASEDQAESDLRVSASE